MTRPSLTDRIHATTWTTSERVQEIAWAGGYPVEVGTDADGDYAAVVTREGVEFKGRLGAVR